MKKEKESFPFEWDSSVIFGSISGAGELDELEEEAHRLAGAMVAAHDGSSTVSAAALREATNYDPRGPVEDGYPDPDKVMERAMQIFLNLVAGASAPSRPARVKFLLEVEAPLHPLLEGAAPWDGTAVRHTVGSMSGSLLMGYLRRLYIRPENGFMLAKASFELQAPINPTPIPVE